MNTTHSLRLAAFAFAGIFAAARTDAFTIDTAGAGAESLYAEFRPVDGASFYEVTYSSRGTTETMADPRLVRLYPGYVRVDIPGVAAGEYTMTIKALDEHGAAIDQAATGPLTPTPMLREGSPSPTATFLARTMPTAR
ncbi:MAG: hypothetical protein K2G30_10050 [Muribaculaceae bacterium]|nr:hypothetical protein [Muribaculaceae bacterium]MDE7141972.1 hypothetical protein [Muribaculaceae bacterium]